ncbi:MAG: hypothetical protein RSE07_05635 [Oscillospiraceae bacterium]
MLGRLLKYEYKATARTFLVLYPVLILLSVFTKILNFSAPIEEIIENFNILNVPKVVVTITFVMMIVATMVITFILSLQRFYKNLLCEEGYLQFTLPVSASSQILSKLIVSITWYIASLIVIFISLAILVPFRIYKEIFPIIGNVLGNLGQYSAYFKEIFGCSLFTFLSLILLSGFLGIILVTMQTYTAMAIGQLVNKNRVAVSFGAFVGLNFVAQIVSMISMVILYQVKQEQLYNARVASDIFIPTIMIAIIIAVVLSATYFFVSNYILSKKLNLQ